MKNQRIKIFWFVAILGWVFSGALWAQAQTSSTSFPVREDTYVNDYANVLDDKYETSIRTLLLDAENTYGKEITLITINRVNEYAVDSTIETFATALFNYWAIDDTRTNDGVLILAAIQDRKIRIEVGAGYGVTMDNPMKIVLDEYILPKFRQNNYNEGLYQGAKAVIRTITGTTPTDTLPEPTLTEQVQMGAQQIVTEVEDNPVPFLGIPAVGVGALFVGWRRYQRYRPRKCPNCGNQMKRLDEARDDQFIEEGQIAEEKLGSVDYDVWECPSCQTRNIFDYRNHFSGYSKCPECSYHTVKTISTTVIAATTHSTGLRRINETCQRCTYRREYTRSIPRVSSSSRSSSGGGGGGGSSSGGGASGSW